MKQLIQYLGSGEMKVVDAPEPPCPPGHVLVRVHFSAISAGTEGKTVRDARAGYLEKARSRKEEVKKVLRSIQSQGLVNTVQTVQDRLNVPSTLGYSASGEVIAAGDGIRNLRVGQWVACGGSQSAHAGIVAVPEQLCAVVADAKHLSDAAFTTIGAIAMQGVRRADLRLGERCLVIGLGLVGQLSLQLLRASGVRAVGIDTDTPAVARAQAQGFPAFLRSENGLEAKIGVHWNHAGADAVLVCASTPHSDPLNLAAQLCRQGGTVVLVGATGTEFDRKTFYKKELTLRLSTSYGPGRYDIDYEELNKPLAEHYVRWTEQRNMQAFCDLLEAGAIQPSAVISHRFDFADAPEAYSLILSKEEPVCGILLHYSESDHRRASTQATSVQSHPAKPVVSLIGAGNFARRFLLPALVKRVELHTVVTSRPNTSIYARDKFGFAQASSAVAAALAPEAGNTVFIATRHDSHGSYVEAALRAGKHVFVEKPLCLTEPELHAIRRSWLQNPQCLLMVGFNRRRAPLAVEAMNFLPKGVPRQILYRVAVQPADPSSWLVHPEQGGGRLLGELCHFVDFCRFAAASPAVRLSALALPATADECGGYSVQISYANGSVASLIYTLSSAVVTKKEWLEIHAAGCTARITDFEVLELEGKTSKRKRSRQNKGHEATVSAFIDAIEQGIHPPIQIEELFEVTYTNFLIQKSIINSGEVYDVSSDFSAPAVSLRE